MQRFYDRTLILAGTAAALAVVLLTGSLGLWQLRRADEKAALQQARDAAAAAPPRVIGSPQVVAELTSAPALPAPAAIDGWRIQALGVFDAARTVFLDNRTRDGVAGFHVLTPLKLFGTNASLLVLRGWVAQDPTDRLRLPVFATPIEAVRVEGLAIRHLDQPMMLAKDVEPGPGDRIWQHVSFEKFGRWSGLDLYPVILRQTVAPAYADGLARDWIQPGTSVDRHQAYAFQWFAMAAAALVAWLVMIGRVLLHGAGPSPERVTEQVTEQVTERGT